MAGKGRVWTTVYIYIYKYKVGEGYIRDDISLYNDALVQSEIYNISYIIHKSTHVGKKDWGLKGIYTHVILSNPLVKKSHVQFSMVPCKSLYL